MKWFQLHTNSLYDPKIVKLIKEHGITGYGVYMGINVLIAERDNDEYTLEHDQDGLETLFNDPNTAKIIQTCLKLGLLTKTKGKLQNKKLSKYVGNWQKRRVTPTEALRSTYRGPTEDLQLRREEKEEKRKKELREVSEHNSDIKSPPQNTPRPTAQQLFDQEATKLANAKKIN